MTTLRRSSNARESPLIASAIGIGCGLWLVGLILCGVGLYSLFFDDGDSTPPARPMEVSTPEPNGCPCSCKEGSDDKHTLAPAPNVTPVHPFHLPSAMRLPTSPPTVPLLSPSRVAPLPARSPQAPLPPPPTAPPLPSDLVPLGLPSFSGSQKGVESLGQAQVLNGLAIPLRKLEGVAPLPPALGSIPAALSLAALEPPATPTSSGRQAGVCLEGDTCAYGLGWCAKADSVKLQKPRGYCKRGECNGPAVAAYPNTTCGSPHLKQTNVTDWLKKLPPYWLQNLRDVPGFNKWMAGVFDFQAAHDMELVFDEVMLKGFQLNFDKADGVWLVGCWPPKRYVVVDGITTMPSGRLIVRTAGFSFVVSFYDASLRFKQLRADVACHAGYYGIVSITEGKEGRKVSPASLEMQGEFNVHCERGWTALCLLLGVGYKWLSRKAMARFPELIAYLLDTIDELELGPGCDSSWHNTVSLLPYSSRKCCEKSFAEDTWGCLVGGQFNGRVPGVKKVVDGVTCEPDRLSPGTHTAKCETLPGHYHQLSPGVCREGPMPTRIPRVVNPGWEKVHWALQTLSWADLLFTAAAWWTLAMFAWCLCCRPSPCDEHNKYLPYFASSA